MALKRKHIILFIFSMILSVSVFSANIFLPNPDTLLPPPSSPDTLNGPNLVCEGDIAEYTGDFSIGCYNIWYVDNSLQPSDSSTLVVAWNTPGTHIVKAYCNDLYTLVGVIEVTVKPLPDVFLGNDTTLMEGDSILLDAGNPGALYLWSTGDTTQTIIVNETGYYSVVVTNDCGNGEDEIFVDILTNILLSSKTNVKVYTSNNQLNFTNFEGSELLTVYALSGKLLYKGTIQNTVHVSGSQVVMVSISSAANPIRIKIFIP
jgi:hypothetical protein